MRTGVRILVAIAGAWGAASAAQDSAPPPSPETMESMKTAWKAQADFLARQAQDLEGLQRNLANWQMAFSADQAGQERRLAEMAAQAAKSQSDAAAAEKLQRGLNEQRVRWESLAQSRDSLYERGQADLERRRWDDAVQRFGQVAASAGSRADGALYWKAYALNKLGRRDEALATLAELPRTHAGSRWLDDAKALELEIRQAAGKPAPPDAENDDDLKIQALNGLRQADSEQTVTAILHVLKSAQSPGLKERALFVLAQSDSPKARQTLEQIARGGGNPDLQLKAIAYLAATRRPQGGNTGQTLTEIYASSNDVVVKRAILNAMMSSREGDRLLQIAKSEKAQDLRVQALDSYLALRPAQDWRTAFGGAKAASSGDIAALYADQNPEGKRAIVNWLAAGGDVKAVIALARSERDREMVRYIVGRLASMQSPEAADYLMEILKK